MIDIFIPSYHRPNNLKTVKFFKKIGYPLNYLHVVIDNEADDINEYAQTCSDINLHVYDINRAREQYDFVHRPSKLHRAAGMARNMIYDIANKLNIKQYCVIDDDCTGYQYRPFGVYHRPAKPSEIIDLFDRIAEFMNKNHIGLFGLSQTGDMFKRTDQNILRYKVMNTTFVHTDYIYQGERGLQDNDTSQFVTVLHFGLFTGSLSSYLVLKQMPSATQAGGLTELYKENKLLNKALTVPIQYPSFAFAEKQKSNGNRLHHHLVSKYMYPKIIKSSRSNIAWDTYPEDIKFTLAIHRTNIR